MSKRKSYEELVKDAISEIDGFIDFNGNNCSDFSGWNLKALECEGWNGVDRRCQCGNRRVSWVLSDCETYVYAEAY